MNAAHAHLFVNHFPIIGGIFGLLILILGFLMKSELTKRIAYGVLLLAALLSIPTFLTGEGAEEIVEELGVSHDIIHEHEEVAEWYFRMMILTGILALVSLLLSHFKHRLRVVFSVVTLVMTLASVIYSLGVYNSGGEIMHKEIRDADAVEESLR